MKNVITLLYTSQENRNLGEPTSMKDAAVFEGRS